MSGEFACCVIIPVYNHPNKIRQIVSFLSSKNLPVLLVDDGSEPHCQQLLVSIQNAFDNTALYRLPANQGKGAAVCLGFQEAARQGFSHALQVDADGQHDLSDVPAFLQLSQQTPESVISASRAYEDMSPSRAKGRKLTDYWVHVHTLSTDIKDSMCGFRLYPLEKTIFVINKYSIPSRMDFDTEILVRLYWEGVEVEHIPSKVTYADEAVSHFHIIKDNVRITLMHTRLFFGMLKRIIPLLRRRTLLKTRAKKNK